jgi:predicted Zn-ribbon and HTH transcriptional regulator
MSKQKTGYNAVLERVMNVLERSPEEFEHWAKSSEEVVDAASDMTKDELALISSYVKRDMKEFAQNYEESKTTFPDSPFYRLISDSMWHALLEITDKTQVEWKEVFDDLEHQGVYQAGEVVGLGILVCEKCGHREQFNHAQIIQPCTHCDNKEFTRVSLKP